MADVCLWVWAGKRVEGGTTRQIRGGLIPGRSAFRCETRVHETCAHRSHFEKEVPWGVKVCWIPLLLLKQTGVLACILACMFCRADGPLCCPTSPHTREPPTGLDCPPPSPHCLSTHAHPFLQPPGVGHQGGPCASGWWHAVAAAAHAASGG
eukprot:scaffold41729_cov17-Tisochrysis_lutea.AAC.1